MVDAPCLAWLYMVNDTGGGASVIKKSPISTLQCMDITKKNAKSVISCDFVAVGLPLCRSCKCRADL